MGKITSAQNHLKDHQIDGWLLYYFDGNNPHAHEFLGLKGSSLVSRRLFYYIPKEGDPIKIVHAIEPHVLGHLPGITFLYDSSDSLCKVLKQVLEKPSLVAMEYSPSCRLPYISKVDAGMVELIESFNVKVVSSAKFLIHFTSVMTPFQYASHRESAEFLYRTAVQVFQELENGLIERKKISEYDVVKKIEEHFIRHGFFTDHSVICAFGKNSADPHYHPSSKNSQILKENTPILLDLFCKKNHEESIYADICKMGFSGKVPTVDYQNCFDLVRKAQKATFEFLKNKIEKKETLSGSDVDAFCRQYFEKHGVLEFFTHRIGHNIFKKIHGPGTHLDSFETLDDRPLIPKTCFSLEPALYYPEKFGVRLEYDVTIDEFFKVHITGEEQEAIFCFTQEKKPLTFDKMIL